MTSQELRSALACEAKGRPAHLHTGNAVRCGCTRPRVNEEQPACRRGFSVVGGQSMQVRHSGLFDYLP